MSSASQLPADSASDTRPASAGHQSVDSQWWKSVMSINNRTVATADRKALLDASLFGKRCLITGAEIPSSAIQMVHLIPKSTSDSRLQKLQYAFGTKLNLNEPWNTLFLRSDIHAGFNAAGWALVPVAEETARIVKMLKVEMDYRQEAGIRGPWPDFQSEEWFPAQPNGYKYHFVPLTMEDQRVPILRYDWTKVADGHPTEQAYHSYHPPYTDFPLLTSHVHPYAAIVNAVPKLLAHHFPDEIKPQFAQMLSICEILVDLDDMPGSPVPSTQTHGSDSCWSSSHDNHSDQELDRSDAIWEEQDNGGTLSTPNGSIHVQHNSQKNLPALASTSPMRLGWNTVDEWVSSVKFARQQNELVTPEDDSLEKTQQYAAEVARSPPTYDWHEWTSEYAPWWVILPKGRERKYISSNDWAEIETRLSLTRRIDMNEVL
ncbi:unnamed protein product [Rhizoctonia solani]|uniref:HNH nuclease domain-containing protein n=1 Tax=Rhizoctonia solani TaxID=456999 RepID=A0A8H3E2H8_9AGAM|nr:unnamed protein product [Rhizoctonia solani]